MTQPSRRLSLTEIAAEHDLFDAVVGWHSANDGRIPDGLGEFSPFSHAVQLYGDTGSLPPPLLFCGPQSAITTLIGPKAAMTMIGRPAGRPSSFDPSVFNAYDEVADLRQPYADMIRCSARIPGYPPVGFIYSRVILPVDLAEDRRAFASFIKIKRILQVVDGSSKLDLRSHRKPTNCHRSPDH